MAKTEISAKEVYCPRLWWLQLGRRSGVAIGVRIASPAKRDP